jgi:uncharacterized protein (DUF608 family)
MLKNLWPVLKTYDQTHISRVAMPLGGIGTGTISLGGRGDLRDWEIMNRPAKGFTPHQGHSDTGPFFALYTKTKGDQAVTRALEGPIAPSFYEGRIGSTAVNHGLPRFRNCSFATAYPLGQVILSDPDVPVDVTIKAFNPLIPCNAEDSGIPAAILRYVLCNKTNKPVIASVCGNMPNFIGIDGSHKIKNHFGDLVDIGGDNNKNEFRKNKNVSGIYMYSKGLSAKMEQWGTIAMTTTSRTGISFRTNWQRGLWGAPLLDFWDDFSEDGKLQHRQAAKENTPMASLAVKINIPPHKTKEITFLITWHFPNRRTWTPKKDNAKEIIGNYYTTQYKNAWDVAKKTVPRITMLETETVKFVRNFCDSDLPREVKEAALFNISTLRTQTCFRTPDKHFFGWEGCGNTIGSCEGSCTHVWNYEQVTPFLFGELAKSMREIEFRHATDTKGLMSFRVHLPLKHAQDYGKAAADGQMGCVMKIYRDWQLSGNDKLLKTLWPHIKKTMEFCWIKGGWDANRDGVMEGCQHNTMDIEYYGTNPQMTIWYLGALRAVEKMSHYLGEEEFARTCQNLFKRGSNWIDKHLFNGRYYEHHIQPPKNASEIADGLIIGMGTENVFKPDFQLGIGCLVDQLIGQLMAHICGLGYLVKPANVSTTLRHILKYNLKKDMSGHFNCMRSFAMGNESALLMAGYPNKRPKNPFPYFTEVMTGFEYSAAIGMLYEKQTKTGLQCIRNIRRRYDGLKRNPFNEAECGHHYARAMVSWAAVTAISGFNFSALEHKIEFAATEKNSRFFWSNGYAWGIFEQRHKSRNTKNVKISVLYGDLTIKRIILKKFGELELKNPETIIAGKNFKVDIKKIFNFMI